MRYLKDRYLIVVILIMNMSCNKDFLDVPDKTSILRQVYVKDLATTGEYLNGIYVEIGSNFYSAATLIYPDLVADNLKPIVGGTSLSSHYSWNQQASEDQAVRFATTAKNANGLWFSGYRIIRDCSFIIETIDQYRDENPSKADNYKGQALALRALVHSVLVNTFSHTYNFTSDATHTGIPYVTTSDYRIPVSRLSVAKVYEYMVMDLTKAVHLLPAATENVLLFNRNAAMALMARIMLIKGDFANAKMWATKVATLIPLMTISEGYPSNLFTPIEKEALFQLPPSAIGVDGGTYSSVYPGYYLAKPFLRFTATNDIATILSEDTLDIRKVWVKADNMAWYVTKYPIGVMAEYPVPAGAYYQTLFRSSEMYLTAAEAYAHLQNEDSARYYLNAIRLRANPLALQNETTGDALFDAINKERRKELAFEGFRLYDLLRQKKGVSRIDAPNPAARDLSFPNNKAICPIPLSDITIAGLQQNTGY